MSRRIRKNWVKKSPCVGCCFLDHDGVPVECGEGKVVFVDLDYCILVTDPEYFFDCRGGKEVGRQRLFRNCSSRKGWEDELIGL